MRVEIDANEPLAKFLEQRAINGKCFGEPFHNSNASVIVFVSFTNDAEFGQKFHNLFSSGYIAPFSAFLCVAPGPRLAGVASTSSRPVSSCQAHSKFPVASY